MQDVEVIDDAATAVVALDPIRTRLLAELTAPGSATTVAARVGLARQKVNYHLRALEAHGLVRVVEERRHGGLTERILASTASSYVVSPAALGAVASDPRNITDRLSARYLVAVAARIVREVGDLLHRADEAGKRLPTLTLDTEIRFRSAGDRAAFTTDLAAAVTALASRYHDESAPGGRSYRIVVGAHPSPRSPDRPDDPPPDHPRPENLRPDAEETR